MKQKININDYNTIKEGFESGNIGMVIDKFKELAEQNVLEEYLKLLSIDLGDDYVAKKLEEVAEKMLSDLEKRMVL